MLRGFLAKMQEAQTQANEANNITRERKNRVNLKWRLVRNRLFLISGRDNVDPAEYFRKERAREGKVIVRNIYTAAKFKNQFKVMIGAYAQYEADKKHFDL